MKNYVAVILAGQLEGEWKFEAENFAHATRLALAEMNHIEKTMKLPQRPDIVSLREVQKRLYRKAAKV